MNEKQYEVEIPIATLEHALRRWQAGGCKTDTLIVIVRVRDEVQPELVSMYIP